MRPVRFALLAWLFVWACSDPQFKAPPAFVPNPDLELLSQDLRRYVGAVCEFEARCGTNDLDTCVSWYLGEVCGGKFGSFELPELDGCLGGIAALGCSASPHELPACLPVRNALYQARPGAGRIVGEGQACNDHDFSYCDFGLFCDADPEQCGLCQKKLAVGNACRVDGSGECRDGAYCSDAGVCTAAKANKSTCAYDWECAADLLCLLGKCQHREDLVGAACQSDEQCGLELPCREGQCQALRDVGEACREALDCQTRNCFDGKCAERPTCERGEPGMSCDWDEQCKPGHVCDWTTSTCAVALADGEHGCYDSTRPTLPCVTGSYCTRISGTEGGDPQNFVCARGVPNGGACPEPGFIAPCVSGYCSEQLKCADKPPVVCD